ncbi:zinc finger CCCH domain-containing protein 41-like [Actinidia eriantha]|uniref:zinc finger CCCH domain-containing protein 41-like n=1 Tax=Actinidia eriantha TaxID=165200 RepID=UPI0025891306|nr:zinc finger CCCH domain-containing protein 41-like [Actinidia eriantha]XP_057464371.1 zinc finger CCCH domain-containing protein 41-like [Actinidia eriantha]XP_057464378.1 zinc finger CCCH domain-containing protein 41-like [Actinidia eriantha]XP_057464381.1 zinc finger CCCH domain-containing protein 41-like [Actinidia eriantha]
MELKVSSPKAGGLSPSDCVSDPEEKEISDDDDDDRNHKHRRREVQSESMERDSMEQVLIRPYRKGNRPFENGHLYRENHSQSNETWKSSTMSLLETGLPAKFEKRRSGFATFPRAPNKVYQPLSADLGSGRCRGRESGSWSQCDPRLSFGDIASQMVPQGSFTPSLFAGRGLPNVSNSQSPSWSAFGLIPGIPNGGMDTLHSLGMQGSFRTSIGPSLNIGIPRPRCRDFEERGFCLRGDVCPMEHGVNRIVVEDVQSLSQFNLPVSLPSAHLLGTSSALPSVTASSSTFINSKSSKSNRLGMTDDGLEMNGVFSGSAGASGTDFYDPDQPLWTNDCPETSTAPLGLNSSKVHETKSFLEGNSSDHHHALFDGFGDECAMMSTATAVGSQSTSSSIWGRISTKRNEMKDKIDCNISSSNYIENEARGDQEPLANLQEAACQGKRIVDEDIGSQADSSLKKQGDTGRTGKPSQKALHTVFVNGIPQKDNRREALLLHFRKFGEVIDIYIPLKSERAFVQFSKREEAEAALKAPDAVMGNRFIRLWWANRDNIPVDGMGSGNSLSVAPRGVTNVSVPPRLSFGHRGRDNLQSAAPKLGVPNVSVPAVPSSDQTKPVAINSPRAPPPLQKKQESLELLKEELRKKQELLDKKRNDFRRQLDKLEKQATGLKGDVSSEPSAKRHNPGTVADVAKAATPRSADTGTVVASPVAKVMAEKDKSMENVVHQSPKQNTYLTPLEPSSLKHSIRPLAPAGGPFVMSRFKLDNRPTTFKIISPLPTGLANVAVLKEHFSAYGELSAVELEDVGSSDSVASKNFAAHISFTTRNSAEKAFAKGNCLQGHDLQFMWLAPTNSGNDNGVRENPTSAFKIPSDANVQPAGEVAPVDPHKVAASGNGEAEILERKESGGECTERNED